MNRSGIHFLTLCFFVFYWSGISAQTSVGRRYQAESPDDTRATCTTTITRTTTDREAPKMTISGKAGVTTPQAKTKSGNFGGSAEGSATYNIGRQTYTTTETSHSTSCTVTVGNPTVSEGGGPTIKAIAPSREVKVVKQ